MCLESVIRVTSTGNDATSPHCSFAVTWQYTDDTKQECAEALCQAQGYSAGGSFVEASNNFCLYSFVNGYIWFYNLNTNQIQHKDYFAEAAITADCTISGIFPLKSYTLFNLFFMFNTLGLV